MNKAADLPVLATVLTAAFLVAGAATTLVGALGLVRLTSFYQRVHAPTLGTTLGTTCVALASMIYFSTLGTRPVLHEVLIVGFITLTTPITLMILVRAALFRDRSENNGALRSGRQNDG
jgi:multicomponent K+:H+ antiporter subunit G